MKVAASNSFEHADIRDRTALDRIFATHKPDAVMHLAAESHVDRSIDGPGAFIETNVVGTHTLLKAIGKKDLDLSNFAFSLRSSKIESKGTFKEGSFFNKQHFQIWSEPERERLLFAPHRTLQILYNDIPDELNLLTQNPIEIPAVTL